MMKYAAIATVAIWLSVAIVGITSAVCNYDGEVVASVAMGAMFTTGIIWLLTTSSS